MKKIFFGFIIGAFLFGGVAFAADKLIVKPNPFPVIIDGVQTSVEGYNINGYTYLKLADFSKAGLSIIFNESDSQIEVKNEKNVQNVQTPQPIQSPQPTKTNSTETKSNPEVISVKGLSATTVEIEFADLVNKQHMENTLNYSIIIKGSPRTTLPVKLAELDTTGKKIIITTEQQTASTLYAIGIQEIIIESGTSKGYCGMTFVSCVPTSNQQPISEPENVIQAIDSIPIFEFDSRKYISLSDLYKIIDHILNYNIKPNDAHCEFWNAGPRLGEMVYISEKYEKTTLVDGIKLIEIPNEYGLFIDYNVWLEKIVPVLRGLNATGATAP